jgi:hypothetical protein
MVSFIFQVEIFIKAILLMIKDKVMDKCFGQMDHFTKVNGEMVLKMVRDKFIYQEMRL